MAQPRADRATPTRREQSLPPQKSASGSQFRGIRSDGMTTVDRLERINKHAKTLVEEGDPLAAYIAKRIKRDVEVLLSAMPQRRG
jgi:hypothetical protein